MKRSTAGVDYIDLSSVSSLRIRNFEDQSTNLANTVRSAFQLEAMRREMMTHKQQGDGPGWQDQGRIQGHENKTDLIISKTRVKEAHHWAFPSHGW